MNVSILIPCHNAERWIATAIRSALEQTWQNKEVIVVDDGSTDRSLDVIRSFGNAIRYETGPNRGGNVARNRLLELSEGEWLQYLDADDYLLPSKIERQLSEFDQSKVDVAYTPTILEYWTESQMRKREVLPLTGAHDAWVELVRWLLPQTGASMWRRSALRDVGNWQPDQPCCQEHELYYRLLVARKSFQFCPTAGAVYRQWSTGTICRKNPLQTLTRRLAIVEAAEQHLCQARELTDERRDAIAFARLECARSIYQLDRRAALRVAAQARRMHPTYKLAASRRFPRAYRGLYAALGFQAAEAVAAIVRPWRPRRTQ